VNHLRISLLLAAASSLLACRTPNTYTPSDAAPDEGATPTPDSGAASSSSVDSLVSTGGVSGTADARFDSLDGPETSLEADAAPVDTAPLPPPCTSGALRCGPSGMAVEMCTAGVWTTKEQCPFVCSKSACAATCMAGVPCSQGIGPCRKGTTTCASPTSQPACEDAGPDDSSGGCTSGRACKSGVCVTACVANVACTDGIAACRKGATFCATPTSQAECRESGVDDSRGGCGGSNVCKAGACVPACKSGVSCTQGIGPCRRGTTSCANPTSAPECNDSGADDSRQTCGSGNVCKGGMCCSSNVGQSCVGNNPCQTGTFDCSGVCHTQNVSGPCGTGAGCVNNATKQADYCQGGQCVSVAPIACSGGKMCTGNQCKCPPSKPVEQGGACYLGEGTLCTDVRDCLPGSDCEGLGVCTQAPNPTCFGSDAVPCPTGGNCVQYKPPESRCHHPM
jgi:hypothetical protein